MDHKAIVIALFYRCLRLSGPVQRQQIKDELDLLVLSDRLMNEVEETFQAERVSLWLREP